MSDISIDDPRKSFRVDHVIAYGQSLSSGWEGGPALAADPVEGTFMLGHSVRPISEGEPHWRPVGDANLHPLVSTEQLGGAGSVLTPDDLSALPHDAMILGETILEAATRTWQAGRVKGCLAVASSCGVGGRSLEELLPGAEPNLFNRVLECRTATKNTVEDEGHEYALSAFLFLQGENNSWEVNGATSDKNTYKNLFRDFYVNILHCCELSNSKTQRVAPVFTYQTGGAYANSTSSIAQAQLEIALEIEGCTLVAPVYALPDRPSGHLDANSYRWLGQQFGKVMHRVMTLGERWLPLHPQQVSVTGTHISVAFHVPVPPLRWGRPFRGLERVDIRDRGFAASDAQGEISITQVALDGPTGVVITLGRLPDGPVQLQYADRSQSGRGMLHDSDKTVATDLFALDVTRPDPGIGDITAMIGLPYALENWCVAFSIAATPIEALLTVVMAPNPTWDILTGKTPVTHPLPIQSVGLMAKIRRLFLPKE